MDLDVIDSEKIGLQKVTLVASDNAGNVATKDINLNIRKDNTTLLLWFQIIFICIVFIGIYRFIKYRKSIALEKRLSKYSVEAVYDRRVSIFDTLTKQYIDMIGRISNILSKSKLLVHHSERYEKYTALYKGLYKDKMDFISAKVVVACLIVAIAIFAKTIQFQVLYAYEIFLPLLFGYLLPDIIFLTKYKLHRNRIENDLLQAIIIMNNAFKSGRSITQAIELVTKELEGPIAEEFKKMHLEISFGLSLSLIHI